VPTEKQVKKIRKVKKSKPVIKRKEETKTREKEVFVDMIVKVFNESRYVKDEASKVNEIKTVREEIIAFITRYNTNRFGQGRREQLLVN